MLGARWRVSVRVVFVAGHGRQPTPTLQMLSRSFINASSSSGKSLGCGEVNRMRTSGTAVETLVGKRKEGVRDLGAHKKR